MKGFLTIVIVLLSMLNIAQAHQMGFKKLYSTTGPSNQGSSIIEQPNGDFIIGGIRSVPIGSQYIANIYLFRIDNKGDTVWTKEIGTATERELAYDMIQLPNNNLLITGSINIPPNGTSDALVIQTDINGAVVWQKQYGGAGTDYATSAAFDGQNIIVCGITESYGAGSDDAWLLKLNMAGDTLWTKTFGGALVDDAWGIIAVHDQYVFTGGTYSYANGSYDDAWVVKTDTSGNVIWRKTFGLKDRVDWAWSIIPATKNGTIDGYAFTGVKDTEDTQPGNANGGMHFVKIDTAGTIVWDKSIDGTPWRREGYCLQQLTNEGFVVSGYKLNPTIQSQQFYVVETDVDGNVLWDTAYGTSDSFYYANGLTATKDGGWAVTGSVFHPAQPIRYIYVTKFNPGGVNVQELNTTRKDILIYPNPVVGDKLYLKVPHTINVYEVVLSSIDGRVIKRCEYDRNGYIKLSEFNMSGLLLIDIYTNKGIVSKRVTVNR